MPKYYCDYCDIFLTHDSSSVRKAHNAGRNHLINVKTYYSELPPNATQSVLDTINKAYAEAATRTDIAFIDLDFQPSVRIWNPKKKKQDVPWTLKLTFLAFFILFCASIWLAIPQQYSGYPQYPTLGGSFNPYGRPPSFPGMPPGMPPMRPSDRPNGMPPGPPPPMFMRPPPGAPGMPPHLPPPPPGLFPPPGFPAGAPFPPPGAPFPPPGAPFPPPGQFPGMPPGAAGAPPFRPPFPPGSIPPPGSAAPPGSGPGPVMNNDRKRRLEESRD
ncbi:hypothetical protein BGZ72_000265 [Mortierella alpina]|nr:hypothetical protein BGZ72_000265 [Mortierella alpina]